LLALLQITKYLTRVLKISIEKLVYFDLGMQFDQTTMLVWKCKIYSFNFMLYFADTSLASSNSIENKQDKLIGSKNS